MPQQGLERRSQYEHVRLCEEHLRSYQLMADDRDGYFLSVAPLRESHTHQTPMGPIIIYGKPSNLEGYTLGAQLMRYDEEQARLKRANQPGWRFW